MHKYTYSSSQIEIINTILLIYNIFLIVSISKEFVILSWIIMVWN